MSFVVVSNDVELGFEIEELESKTAPSGAATLIEL